jgi:hypothetical protein
MIAVLAMQLLHQDCRAGNLKLYLQEQSTIKKRVGLIFLTKLVTFIFSNLKFLLSVSFNEVTEPRGETNKTEST